MKNIFKNIPIVLLVLMLPIMILFTMFFIGLCIATDGEALEGFGFIAEGIAERRNKKID